MKNVVIKNNACLFLAGIILFICSCKKVEEQFDSRTFTYSDVGIVKIEPSMKFGEEVLGSGGRVAILGDYIIVSEMTNTPPIHVFNLANQLDYRSFGNTGRGPGEFLSTDQIAVVDQYHFAVNDPQLKRLTIVNVNDLAVEKIVNYNLPGMAFNVIPHSEGFYADGLLPEGIVARLNHEGQVIGYLLDFPELLHKNLPPLQKARLWMHRIVFNPELNRLALVFFRSDKVILIDNTANTMLKVSGPDIFDPVYGITRRDDSSIMTHLIPESRYAYISGTSSENRVYFLYSGAYQVEDLSNYARYIHVFDWEGNIMLVLEIDEYLYSIAIDEDRGFLVGMVIEPTPMLVKYDISGIVLGLK